MSETSNIISASKTILLPLAPCTLPLMFRLRNLNIIIYEVRIDKSGSSSTCRKGCRH